MHTPVLVNEVLAILEPKPGDRIIDGTVDGGGHASAILERILPEGVLLGTEWDAAMLEKCRERLKEFPAKSLMLVQSNYADIAQVIQREKFGLADGLLLDLGFSSEQLIASGRGFSFGEISKDEPLLMTYDDAREPVAEIISRIKEEELAKIIFELGGERGSRKIAKAIVEYRRKKVIRTAGELADVVRSALPKNYERGRIDPATRTFQALRIYANGELENLERILGMVTEIVKPGGHIAIISFHSLEDRIVKNAFRNMAKQGIAKIVNKKPITASREEVRENPRSRSAKLRGIQISD